MNIPNIITLTRIVLIPFFLLAVLTRMERGGLIAAAIFIVAAVSDGVDGYLARKHNSVTRLGKFLDPLADKLLIAAALIALVELEQISTWVAVIIIGREIAVTGLRAIAAAEGTVIAAGPWGKAKTLSQIIFIVTAILSQSLPMGTWLRMVAGWLATPLMWVAVALTIWSGVDYGVAYYRGLNTKARAAKRKPQKYRIKVSNGISPKRFPGR